MAETILSFLEYLPEYKVLTCLEHGCCLKATGLVNHLNAYHKGLERGQGKRAQEAVSALDLLPPSEAWRQVAEPAIAIPQLRKPVHGFRCTAVNCQKVKLTPKDIRSHATSKHQWKGGRANQVRPWREGLFQTFFL